MKTDVDFLNMMRRFRETATTLPLQLHQHRQIDDLMKRFFEEKK